MFTRRVCTWTALRCKQFDDRWPRSAPSLARRSFGDRARLVQRCPVVRRVRCRLVSLHLYGRACKIWLTSANTWQLPAISLTLGAGRAGRASDDRDQPHRPAPRSRHPPPRPSRARWLHCGGSGCRGGGVGRQAVAASSADSAAFRSVTCALSVRSITCPKVKLEICCRRRARVENLGGGRATVIWTPTRPLFYGLESAASSILNFQTLRVPGLLQTPAYTTALLNCVRPAGEASSEMVGERVQARRRRQAILDSAYREFKIIVDEAALRRAVGSPLVMEEQVRHAQQLALRKNIDIRVVPFDVGEHPGMDGSFTILRFDQQLLSDVVFIEGLGGSVIIEGESQVATYRGVFDDLLEIALPEEDSSAVLEGIRQNWADKA